MATDALPPGDPVIDIPTPSDGPETPPDDVYYALEGQDVREKALPIRPGDLTRLILSQPGLDADDRRRMAGFADRLGAFFHAEFYKRLRDLKEAYAPFDPDSDYATIKGCTREVTDTLDEHFLHLFEASLERANYRNLEIDIIKAAVASPNEDGLNYVPDFDLFEHLRVYARGYTKIIRITRNLRTRFRKRTIILDAYQRLIVVLKFKDGAKGLGTQARSDRLYIRMFKDVPHVDMEMHLPEQGTRVRMRMLDKAQIASPLMIGLPTIAAKVFAAAVTLSPMVLGAAIVAPVSAGINSFFGFQRAKQKHLSHMIRNLYYLTMANNGSVLNRLVDSAEEEEFKETLLSYYFLWKHHDSGRIEPGQLDAKVEAFLEETTGVAINFEIEDAVKKLIRLKLATFDPDGHLVATPIDRASATLETLWTRAYGRS